MTLRLGVGPGEPRFSPELPSTESLFDVDGIERLGDLTDVADPHADVETQVAESLRAASALREIGRLPSRSQNVVDLLYGLGGKRRSYRYVATRLQMSVAEVRRLEASALAKLRFALERELAA